MKISHERPSADTSLRVWAPLDVILADGTRIAVRQWSLRAIHDAALAGQDLIGARLSVPFQGFDVAFPVHLRASGDGTEWIFEGLTGRQREALGLFHNNLLSGRMASTGAVITALDTPVDLVPMGETDEERAAGRAKAKPRGLRILWNLIYYVALFGAVFGYLGYLGWARLDHVSLTNARYSAPFLALATPQAGFVRDIPVAVHTPVRAGDLLMRLSDPDAEIVLTEMRAAIERSERTLTEITAQRALHETGRADARAKLAPEPAALVRFDAGLSDLAGDFHDIRKRLDQEIRATELDLRALKAERGRVRDAALSLEIRAPADGRVEQILVQPDSYQRIGAPLLTFETNAAREVLGWLDEAQAGSVWEGMRATIRYGAQGETRSIEGRVSSVAAGIDPTAPDRYGMVVRIALTGLTLDQARAILPHNTPVKVDLSRDLARRWFGIGAE